jgi:hypothetical protein
MVILGGGRAGERGKLVMQELGRHRWDRELKTIVAEASVALARLDAHRLEELALSCQALNRDQASATWDEHLELGRQSKEAAGEMAVLARVLEATRANLDVMNKLRALREGRLEYGAGDSRPWTLTESDHGNN